MKNRDIKLQTEYCLSQGAYWLTAVVLGAYITPLLLSKGFSEYQIGIITAVKCIATCIFQLLIAGFADKYAYKIQLKYIIAVLLAVGFLSSIAFYITTPGFYVTLVIFMLFGIGITCTAPLIDSLSALFINHGRIINYTVARGCGSVTWAVASLLLGDFCTKYGENNLLLLQAVFILFLIIIILLMEKVPAERKNGKTIQKEISKSHSIFSLLKTYPKFTVFIYSVFLASMCYNLSCCFLINVMEKCGGNQFHLGIANFVLAISELPVALLFGKIRKYLKLETMLIIFTISNTLKAGGIMLSVTVWQLIASQLFEMFGFGLFYASSLFFVMETLPDEDVVKGVSFSNMVVSGIGAAAGSYLSGIIFAEFGLDSLLTVSVLCGCFSIIIMWYNACRADGRVSDFESI